MNESKTLAAKKALEWVKEGMTLGLGTGSTANAFLRELAQWPRTKLKSLTLVSSSFSTDLLARELGLDLVPLANIHHLDLYIDGADEVDPAKNLLKGRGAAMVREKVLAEFAKVFLVLIDETKLVKQLGTHFPVPIEVLPLAYHPIQIKLSSLGGNSQLRTGLGKDGPIVTDQGNFVLDTRFESHLNLAQLDKVINQIPGVLGHGIFTSLAHTIIIGKKDSVELIH